MKHDRLDSVGWSRVILGMAVLLAAGGLAQADGQCGNDECVFIVVDIDRIVEDPDPILMWEEFTDSLGYPLNPGGEERGDGPADLVLDPVTGVPLVVWSYNIGSSFEIAFTQWSYEGWSPLTFLTTNAWDDLDPQITVGPDGTPHVAWWYSDGSDRNIRLSKRPLQSGTFDVPSVIAANGRRPSILFGGNTLLVAFERPISAARQQVVVYQQQPGQPPTERVIATVQRSQPIHVRLQKDNGVVWMYWHITDRLAGYTEFRNGEWGVAPGSFLGGGQASGSFANIGLAPSR